LKDGSILVGYGFLLLGAADITFGLAILSRAFIRRAGLRGLLRLRVEKTLRFFVFSVAVLVGIGLLGLGVQLLLARFTLFGVVALLLGVGYLLNGMSDYLILWRFRSASVLGALPGALSSSAAFLVLGAMFLDRSRLLGAAFLLFGTASAVGVLTYSHLKFPRRVLAWLTTRDDGSTAQIGDLGDSTKSVEAAGETNETE
jgi:hypothetical protein